MPNLRGSRKLITGLVLLLVGLGITLARGDIPPGLLSLLQALYASFVVGNGVEHIGNIVATKKATKDV